jgi:putative GTP pyrophosphokinase
MALAGMFEIADREFQGIQDADVRLTAEARSRVEAGQLNNVEITPDALKAFLDQRIGPDGRISEYSYDWTARLLKRLGFRTLGQVEKCIRGYNDDQLSRLGAGARQGQTTRFGYMLLAGMGDNYLRRHIFSKEPWWGKSDSRALAAFRSEGVDVRCYDPTTDVPEATTSGEPHETVIHPTDGSGVVQAESDSEVEAEGE